MNIENEDKNLTPDIEISVEKTFGFKSKFIPSLEVKRITGTECAYFSLKERIHMQKTEKDNSNGRLAWVLILVQFMKLLN